MSVESGGDIYLTLFDMLLAALAFFVAYQNPRSLEGEVIQFDERLYFLVMKLVFSTGFGLETL